MISRFYKNHNVTIKRDTMEDGVIVRDVLHLLELMENDIDAPDVATIPHIDVISPCAYGNSGGGYDVALDTQDGPFWYLIDADDVDAFNSGKTVRFRAIEPAPCFVF